MLKWYTIGNDLVLFPPFQVTTISLFQRVHVSELQAFSVSRTLQSTFFEGFNLNISLRDGRPKTTQLVWRPMLSGINSVVQKTVANPAQLDKPEKKLIWLDIWRITLTWYPLPVNRNSRGASHFVPTFTDLPWVNWMKLFTAGLQKKKTPPQILVYVPTTLPVSATAWPILRPLSVCITLNSKKLVTKQTTLEFCP